MKYKWLILLACLRPIAVLGQGVRGDTITDRTHQLREVTITESRQQRMVSSTAPLHVLGDEDIRTLGVTDIADALHRIPGVTLRDYGGAGGMKTVSVRGFGAKHVGVSYDGVMLSDCQSGETDLSRYSLDNVERLSLVVGDNDDIFIPAKNASSTAVLDISTFGLSGQDGRAHLKSQVRVGSFGYVSPYVRYEQRVRHDMTISAIGEYTYAKNDYPFDLNNNTVKRHDRRDNSRMNTGHGEVNFSWDTGERSCLSGKVYYYDNDRQLPGVVHLYTNLSRESLRDRNFFGQLNFQTHNEHGLSLKWIGKFNWNASIYKNPLIPNGAYDASYWQRECYTSAALLYAPSEKWAFDYSADYSFNNLSSNSAQTINSQPYRHTILQSATARYRDGRLTALVRLLHSLYLNDANHGPSAHNMRRLSPSLSLSYRVMDDEQLYVRASYKEIFRAPTFNESYYFHYGSTDLEPETTSQFNVGLTWEESLSETTHLQLFVDGYYNRVKDMIVAVPYNMFIWTCINVGKVSVLGAEVTAHLDWQPAEKHRVRLQGNYSYQQAENHTTPNSPYYGNQIAYIPLHTGSIAIGWENPWVSLSVHGSGSSNKWATNQHNPGKLIDGYWDTGVTAYHLFRWGRQLIEARIDVKNIFDRQYEIVQFYPMPGRSWQMSISYQI